MRYRILSLFVALATATSLWAAPPTEEARLEQLKKRVGERQAELTTLYTKHGLEADWSSQHLKQAEGITMSQQVTEAEELLHSLEAEINMIKIRETHGFDLAISGMVIVFCGLASISIFISLLPKILAMRDRKPAPAVSTSAASAPAVSIDGLDDELLTAIALVIHAEAERASGQNLKVTLGLNPSPWALSSQMRVLPGRIHS
jgi:hypothetical protein